MRMTMLHYRRDVVGMNEGQVTVWALTTPKINKLI